MTIRLYQCTYTDTHRFHFILADFPRVTVGPENPLQVEKDETAQLVCQVDAKPTVNTVKWTRNGRFIDTHFKHTIPRVTLQDSGTYVCSADNGLGQVGKAELKLDVLYGPVVSLEPEQREFNEGKRCIESFFHLGYYIFLQIPLLKTHLKIPLLI